MRKIYTGIDVGSDSIKIVTSEFLNDRFYTLASVSVKSVGITRGIITDYDMALNSLNLAKKEIEKALGTSVNKAIITVPSNDRNLSVIEGSINLYNEFVTGEDVTAVLGEASVDRVEEYEEIVSIIPILFSLDEDRLTPNPNGAKSSVLGVKALLAKAPKKQVYSFLKLFADANIEVVDVTFNCIGDYFEARDKETDNTFGALINIGHEKTDVSIFNKGILIKNSIINLGSKNIDKDISYVYGIDINAARELKEKFALASRRYADINETVEFMADDKDKVTINQYEITEVVEARIVELLKLAKKEINSLTKRKISYIIVTGGIAELMGFSYVVENILGINSSTLNATSIGIRNDKFSSAIGIIKYFHNKMALRERDISMLDEDEINEMMQNKKSELGLNNDVTTSKIFGYFYNN